MGPLIREYYRKHDDFRRYLMVSEKRVKELSRLYAENKQFFGERIVDLACGGGVLGFVVAAKGHEYLGIDTNPDMITAATSYSKKVGSGNKFLLRDIRSAKVEGQFETLTLLGNALCHFGTLEFLQIVRNFEKNAHVGTYFIVDYRDVVALLFAKRWAKRYSEKREGKVVTSVTKEIDTEQGNLILESVQKDSSSLLFTHAMWSPFIIEAIMNACKWQLVKRKEIPAWDGWLEVYRRES